MTNTRRVPGTASGGQTGRVSGTASGGQTRRVPETVEADTFLLLLEDTGYLLLEGDAASTNGGILLEGDARTTVDIATIVTKRVSA